MSQLSNNASKTIIRDLTNSTKSPGTEQKKSHKSLKSKDK